METRNKEWMRKGICEGGKNEGKSYENNFLSKQNGEEKIDRAENITQGRKSGDGRGNARGKKRDVRFLTRQEKEERRRKGEGRINHEYVKKGGKLRQRERQRKKKKLEGTSNCNKNTHTHKRYIEQNRERKIKG